MVRNLISNRVKLTENRATQPSLAEAWAELGKNIKLYMKFMFILFQAMQEKCKDLTGNEDEISQNCLEVNTKHINIQKLKGYWQ